MAQIVPKGTPRGQTDRNQACRTDRGVSSGGYDSSGSISADINRHSSPAVQQANNGP